MNKQISELMDGELDEEEALRLLGALQRKEAQQGWQLYHLIGDTLRATPSVSNDFMERLNARLAEEPTVLAPNRIAKHKSRTIALSAAASVAAVGLAVWAVLQTGTENTPAELIVAKAPQATVASANVNPYLLAHQEYSPSIAQGMTSYIHTVSDVQEGAAR